MKPLRFGIAGLGATSRQILSVIHKAEGVEAIGRHLHVKATARR